MKQINKKNIIVNLLFLFKYYYVNKREFFTMLVLAMYGILCQV